LEKTAEIRENVIADSIGIKTPQLTNSTIDHRSSVVSTSQQLQPDPMSPRVLQQKKEQRIVNSKAGVVLPPILKPGVSPD